MGRCLPVATRHTLESSQIGRSGGRGTLATSLREGDDIVAVGDDETYSPQHAAKKLGMSRTHLYKLLDKGVIPSHRVGRDRRIAGKDLFAFDARRDAERRDLAERFAYQDATRAAAVEETADLL
jgi:excisionase family DNA binding protein